MKGRLTVLVLVMLGLGAGGAQAAWLALGSGGAAANAGALVAATNVQAGASGSTVTVTWTAPDGGILSPTYAVTRSPAGGTCSGGPTTSCTDTGVAPGNYTYTVRVVAGEWVSAGAISNSVTVVAAPTVATTFRIAGLTDKGVVETGSTWTPRVEVLVRDNLGAAVVGATVNFSFLGAKGATQVGNCITLVGGVCTLAMSPTDNKESPATVSVTTATQPTLTYDPTTNTMTSVTVVKR